MPSQEPRILLDFGDEDLLEVVCQFGSTHSFDDDSSFISDQPGPGRTVDKIISVAGRRLENALSSISERLGRGPNVAMGRCLAAADRAWLSHFPDWHHPIHSSGFLRRPPPSTQLLEDAFSNIRWGTPELVHDQTFIDSCRSLISYLKSDKLENTLLAIDYITALACFNPDIPSHLVRLGAPQAIHAVCSPYSLLSKGNRDRSLLLVSSRRALVMLSDSTALTTIDAFDSTFRSESKDQSTLDVHRNRLFSDLLALSLNSETQILAARYLTDYAHTRFHVENGDALQCNLPFSILANWVTLALTTDPLSSTAFRRLIENLVHSSYFDTTNDTIFSLFACLLQWNIRGREFPFVDEMLRHIIKHRLGSTKWRHSRHTSETALVPLRPMLSQSAHFNPSSINTTAFDVMRCIVSPSEQLWRAFYRHWYPQGFHFTHGPVIPLRPIPLRTQTQLCRRLLDLVLRGECPATDVLQCASLDAECHQTITHLLETATTTSDTEADFFTTLREMLSSRSTVPSCSLFEGREISGWCTGIYRGPATGFQQQAASFKVSSGHFNFLPRTSESESGSHSTPELLLGDNSSLRWTMVSEFVAQGKHQNPVRVAGGSQARNAFIAGIPNLDREKVYIFAIADDLVVPEEWAFLGTENMHILTGCDSDGQLTQTYWYHRWAPFFLPGDVALELTQVGVGCDGFLQ